MPDVAHGDHVSPADGGKHGCYEVYSAELFELLCFEIIPTAVVHPLAEKFNGGLGAVLLLLRHVEIVDKDDNLVSAFFGPVLAFPAASADLAVDETLDLVGIGLSGEASAEESVVCIVIVEGQLIGHIDRLAGTGRPAEQHMHVVLDVQVEEVVEPDRVVRRDQQVVETDLFRNHEGWGCLRPVLPHELLCVVVHVEDVDLVRHFDSHHDRSHLIVGVDSMAFQQVRSPVVEVRVELAELLARGLFDGCAHGPYATENALVGQNFVYFLGHFSLLFVVRIHIGSEILQVGADKSHF